MAAEDNSVDDGISRREALLSIGGIAVGAALGSVAVTGSALAAGETGEKK